MSDNEILTAILNKLDNLDNGIQELKQDVTQLKQDVTQLKQDVTQLKQDVAQLKQDVAQLKQDVAQLNHRTTSIELTLETETNRNIKIIAEGHADLSRKLDDALTVENEKELFLARLNTLENDVRILKEKVG